MARAGTPAAVLLAVAIAGCGTSTGSAIPSAHSAKTTVTSSPTPRATPTTAGTTPVIGSATAVQPVDPLAGVRLYVDPASSAAQQEASWRAGGRGADADQIAKIARQSQGMWFTTDSAPAAQDAHALAQRAAAAGETPLAVLYDLPDRDCAGYSAGGAANAATYRAWVADLARGFGHSAPVVILEPDGIPSALGTCLSDAQRTERLGLLADAVTTLTSQTGARVYLDAGNPGWVQDTASLAAALRSAGIAHAAGFALNVANFYTTAASIAYGHQIAQQLGGAHFVIDTSRNGNGPATDDSSGAPHWCNPPGRALGQAPTVHTGDPALDALLWVKNPGESDGACRPGAPAAGQWWPQYALQLATATS
jgi:endoglucanase